MPMSDFSELPSGAFSAFNVNVAEMPFVVCSGAGGSVFFKDENMAKVYAAREVNRGNELSMTICKMVPVARIMPKSLDVDIQDLTPSASGKVAISGGDSQQSGGDNHDG